MHNSDNLSVKATKSSSYYCKCYTIMHNSDNLSVKATKSSSYYCKCYTIMHNSDNLSARPQRVLVIIVSAILSCTTQIIVCGHKNTIKF